MQAHTQSIRAARDPLQAPNFPAGTAAAAQLSPSSVTSGVAHGVGLAHDAGNLFAALGLYCDLLNADGVLRPEHRHYASELRLIAERSERLIARLVGPPPAAASDEATEADGAPNAVDAAHVLREAEPLLAAIVGRAATLTCKAPRALPTPPLPAEALERILVNLVRNAAQAIELAAPRAVAPHAPAGQIRVTLATLAGNLRLTVEDNGPGMAVTTAAAFLSPAPTPKGARHGLGHRIVHGLVTSSGGSLALRVRPGRGTTVTVQWPVPDAATPGLSGPARGTVGVPRPGAIAC